MVDSVIFIGLEQTSTNHRYEVCVLREDSYRYDRLSACKLAYLIPGPPLVRDERLPTVHRVSGNDFQRMFVHRLLQEKHRT